jgi:ferredoxin
VQTLTDEIRVEARRLGLNAIGFAPYDPKYTFQEAPAHDKRSVIVCILEQDWAITQQAPSLKTERHVMRVYGELGHRASDLAEFVQSKGFRAQPNPPGSAHSVVIHYGQEAGLGQMGLNGQLLTPQAGSRCRITLITTDAALVYGEPVDFGVHAICDACQLCVRRCPPGAIPLERRYHRGVKKAKIKIDRCLPTVAQAHGCAVCIKVCPVQRYGLDRVRDHYVATGGEILGKGTDELEGFTWPLDGRHYGPGDKPRITNSFIKPPSLVLDPNRKVPPVGSYATAGPDVFDV